MTPGPKRFCSSPADSRKQQEVIAMRIVVATVRRNVTCSRDDCDDCDARRDG
jgi:hypothetical protein